MLGGANATANQSTYEVAGNCTYIEEGEDRPAAPSELGTCNPGDAMLSSEDAVNILGFVSDNGDEVDSSDDGKWNDADPAEPRAYVCSGTTPIVAGPPPVGTARTSAATRGGIVTACVVIAGQAFLLQENDDSIACVTHYCGLHCTITHNTSVNDPESDISARIDAPRPGRRACVQHELRIPSRVLPAHAHVSSTCRRPIYAR